MKPAYFFYVLIFLFPFLPLSFLAHADSSSGEWCHTISTIGSVSSAYGSPVNLFNEIHEPLISVTCYGKEKTLVHVGSGYPTQYIYKYGYRKVDGKWTKTSFFGDVAEGEWIIGSATASIEGLGVGEEGKILAYICQKIGNDWKCGCADTVCSSQKWQLQEYKSSLAIDTVTNTNNASNDDSNIFYNYYKDLIEGADYSQSIENADSGEYDELDVHYPTKYIGLPGETVTLIGSGFGKSPTNSVLWNGKVQQTNISSETGGKLDIVIPNLSPGRYDVKIKEGNTVSKYGAGLWIGTGDNSSAPIITYISPETGSQGGTFTIHGTGFTKEDNEIISTFGIMLGLPSEDGTSITFSYDPFDEKLVTYTPNAERWEYKMPVNVTIMNTSGESNMKMFYLNI